MAAPRADYSDLGFGGQLGSSLLARPRKKPQPPKKKPMPSIGQSLLDQINAELDTLYAPSFADLENAKKQEQERTAGRTELTRALYAQLADYAKGVAPAVQGIYQGAAENTTAFASGYSDAMKAKLDASAAEANQLQQNIGAPEGQRVQGGEAAANVLFGVGGAIPGATLEAQGAGFASAAAYYPASTFGRGLQDIQALLNESDARLKEIDDEGRELGLKRDADRVQLLKERKQLRKDEAKELFNAGLISQRELARRLGVKGWKKFPDTLQGEGGELKILEVGDSVIGIDPSTGKTTVLFQGKAKPNVRTVQLSDGRDILIDLNTGSIVTLGGAAPPDLQIRGSQKDGYTIFNEQGQIVGSYKGKGGSGSSAPLWKQNGFKSAADMNATANTLAREAKRGTRKENPQFGVVAGAPKYIAEDQMGPQEAYDHLVSNNIPPAIAARVLKRYYPKATFPKAEPASGGAGFSGKTLIPTTSWNGTHITDGLDWNNGQKTAIDIMAKAGTPVGAPESGRIIRHSSAQGGQAMWFLADSGIMYWLGHIDNMSAVGSRVRRGQVIAYISANHASPHLHIDRKVWKGDV